MSKLDKYNIDLRQLRSVVEDYRFELDDSFFEAIEATLVTSGDVVVNLNVKTTGHNIFVLTFKIDGVVQVPCDRCLDDVDINLHTEKELRVKAGDSFADDGEIVVLSEDDTELNVAWYIYEFIVLEVPMTHVHEEGKCNDLMLETLRKHLVSAEQKESEEEYDENVDEKIDPRWNELKKILDNN